MNIVKIFDQIDGKTYYKGLDYYHRDLIKEVSYHENNNTFTAVSHGTRAYQLEAKIEEGEIISYACDCPVEGLCKHIAGLLIHIKKNPKELVQSLLPKALETNAYLRVLDEIIKNRFAKIDSLSNYFSNIKKYYHEITSPHEKDKLEIFFSFGKIEKENQTQFIYETYLEFEKISHEMDKKDLSGYVKVYVESLQANYQNNIGLKELFKSKDNFKVMNEYLEAIILEKPTLFMSLPLTNEEKSVELINHAIDSEKYYLPFLKQFNKLKLSIENYILTHMDKNSLMMKTLSLSYLFDIDIIKSMSVLTDKNNIIQIINHLELRPKTLKEALELKKIIPVSISYFDYKADYKEIIGLKKEIITYDVDNFKNYLMDCLNKTYIYGDILSRDDIFECIREFNFIDEKITREYNTELVARNIITPPYMLIITEGGLPYSLKSMGRVVNKIDNNLEYKILLQLNEKDFTEKVTILQKRSENYVEVFKGTIENNILIHEYNLIKQQNIIDVLCNDPKLEVIEAYETLEKSLHEKRIKNLEEQNKIQSKKLIDELVTRIVDTTKVILKDKVEIKPILIINTEEKQDTDDTPLISLKIGQRRDYIIKDIPLFLDTIEHEETYTYGKELSFHHTIEQFSETAKKIISIIETYKEEYPYKSYYAIKLKDKNLNYLINQVEELVIDDLSKDTVKIPQGTYTKTSDFNAIITANKEEVKTNLELSDGVSFLIKLNKEDILINTVEKTFAKISYMNDKQREFVHFILENNDFNMAYVLNEMSSKILPLVKKEVSIDDELLAYMDKFELKIESFIDYDTEEDTIYITQKYYEDKKEIIDITEYPIYDNIINNYNNTLLKFGFEHNKIVDPQLISQFLIADLTPLKEYSALYIGNVLQRLTVKKMTKANIQITTQNGMLLTHIGETNLDSKTLQKVLKAYEEGKKYILLENEVILTDTEEVEALASFIKQHDINIQNLDKTYIHPMYHLFKYNDPSEYLNIEIEDELKNIILSIRNFESKEILDKPEIYNLLKPYQKSGYKWLKTLYDLNLGGVLADDMGLGKTIQVITLLETIKTEGLLLVACPKSLVYNWENEVKKFKANFNTIIYTGLKEQREEILENIKKLKEKTLIITSYDTLRNDLEMFKSINFDTFVLDEAQHIKNITALKTKAVKDIYAKHRFVLTGTPLENSISDLWSIFDFLMPGYLYNYTKFKKIEQKASVDDKKALDFIIDKTRPFILRRTKKNVLKELPSKTEEIMYARFSKEEKDIYDAYLLKIKTKLEKESVSKIDFLADLMKLRQLCLSPSMVYDTYKEDSSKIELATELLENAVASGHKVLVFSSFVKALDILKEKFSPDTYYMITGKTDAKQRVVMANDFNQKQSKEKIFFISLKAGGTGLNLTGADIVIHLDPWWNLAAENQATDRAHRIGQENNVTVYKMIMKSSIEEKVLELQEKKRELFERIINGSEEEILKLDEKDYKFLIE